VFLDLQSLRVREVKVAQKWYTSATVVVGDCNLVCPCIEDLSVMDHKLRFVYLKSKYYGKYIICIMNTIIYSSWHNDNYFCVPERVSLSKLKLLTLLTD
jgi:hypothetical protein